MTTPQNTAPWFTSFNNGIFYIDGVPTKTLIASAERQGWLRFPSLAWRDHLLNGGPRPISAFDSLPDERGATNG